MPKLTNVELPYFFRQNPIGNGSSAVVRWDIMDAIKFQANLYGTLEDFYFDDRFRRAEDIEFWLRIAIQTPWKFEGIPEVLTLYRVNSNGLSASLDQQLEAWKQVLDKVNSYAPVVFRAYGNLGMAYRLRYLARNAVRFKSGAAAVRYINQALITHWKIVLEDPRSTLTTLISAYLLWLLPRFFYVQIEVQAAKLVGLLQHHQIQKELV